MSVARLLLAGSLLAAAGPALAADIDILAAPEITTVEPDTGWYLRADVAYGFDASFGGTQRLFAGGGAIADRYRDWRLDEGLGAGAGLGYKASDWLRFDATVDAWKRDVEAVNGAGWFCGFDRTCGSRDRADIRAVEVMGNAYLDLGTLAGFTPYVGAGLGAVHVSYGDVQGAATCADGASCAAAGLSATYAGEDSWRFAYAVSAGVSYDVTETLTIDTGYRYLNAEAGDAYRYEPAAGTVLVGEDDGFERHTIRAGLRFKFW
ncbi:outer membrane protein [Aureimonas flava]|nr:outer membrane beta-barrel protein [Aureimonas flava]